MEFPLIYAPNLPQVGHEATFESLPNIAKRAIFHQLNFQNLQICRLVCKDWFHVVNASPKFQQHFDLFISDDNWDWTAQLLGSLNEDLGFAQALEQEQGQRHREAAQDDEQNGEEIETPPPVVLPTPMIHHLRVANLVAPIPIYSASRSRVPISKLLSLYAGISSNNLARLLQYQAPAARQVLLHDFSLVNLDPNSHLLNQRMSWENLGRLSFVFWYEINKTAFLDFTKHVALLGQLLSALEVPNLRIINASIDFPKLEEVQHGRVKVQFMEQVSQKFNQVFATFLSKWGSQLSRFYLYLNGINILPILESFKFLANVRKFRLKIHNNDAGLQPTDISLPLQHFKSLTTLRISLPPEFEQVTSSTLLRNNKTTLASLEVQHWITSLQWIVPPFDNNMQYMELRWKIQDSDSIYKYWSLNRRTYQKMKRLKLYLHVELPTPDSNQTLPSREFRPQLLQWIIQFMPNLLHLEVISTNTLVTDLVTVPYLVNGLKQLKRVDLYDCWKSLHKGIPLYDLENWCKQNERVEGAWINDYEYYRIDIL